MPTIVTPTVAVGAGASVSLLAGNLLETLPYDAKIECAIVAEAVGVLVSVTSGTDIVQEDGPAIVVAANGMPRYKDDFYLEDIAASGEKLTIRARNTTGGAINVRSVTRITPLG